MAFNKTDKADGAKVRRGGIRRRKKVCVFCGDKNGVIDYKDTNKLKKYMDGAFRPFLFVIVYGTIELTKIKELIV